MCGIVGYIGDSQAVPILLTGLGRLEYRGYDSAGVAFFKANGLEIVKAKGKLENLENKLDKKKQIQSTCGIGHTRWATHGSPFHKNAHPHTDCQGKIAIVHNGIIENFAEIKKSLQKNGHKLTSDTDSELIAHLLEYYYSQSKNFLQAFKACLKKLIGAYGLVVISSYAPGKLFCARSGSPLVIGLSDQGNFVASDALAFLSYTDQAVYLQDGDIAVLTATGHNIMTLKKKSVYRAKERIENDDIGSLEKEGYKHFMLKEIFEQPKTLAETLRGRVRKNHIKLGGLVDVLSRIRQSQRVILCACGTSYYACQVGEYLLEEFIGWPVEVEYASEFRYRKSPIDANTLFIVISQSGETKDTLEALKKAKQKGALTLGICNSVGSSIARLTDAGVYLHAGPEIGVASTKAFTSQVLVLSLLTLLLLREGKKRSPRGYSSYLRDLETIPQLVSDILATAPHIKKIANKYKNKDHFLYLGRGYNFPVALEGALKLKEISYIHAEGYPAAEMKHGPIALIDKKMPVVVIATQDEIYEKVISNIEEIKSRGGRLIIVATQGDNRLKRYSQDIIYVPRTRTFLYPLLTVIPLQLLAYYIADAKKLEVDQPRNLAKAVTVE